MKQQLQDLNLFAKENNWRLFMTRKADPAFRGFQQKIFQRDHYTCQFCGFQSQYFLDVVNLDYNFLNNRKRNLSTACPFCTQCFFLEIVGKSDFGGGNLIYLPEMPQNALNALCHILFAKIVNGSGTFEKTARNIYRSLKLRTQQVEKVFGEGLSNPSFCGQLLIETNIENKKKFLATFNTKVRLLPDMSRFSEQIDTWMQAGLQSLMY